MKNMYVYIITNKTNTTLYVGVTNDLIRRIYEHKHHLLKGFSDRYNLEKLVYYECFDNELNAIQREKTLKKYKRDWKIKLIEGLNPQWNDLYNDVCR